MSLVSIGRFHHFHLARQLESRGLLEVIFTGYPRFKLRNELGIPPGKIRTHPWLQAPYMARGWLGLTGRRLSREWGWRAVEGLDRYAARSLCEEQAIVAISGSGLRVGTKIQQRGGIFLCDRGSSHLRFQNELLREEFRRWDAPYSEVDPRLLAKEETEYQRADRIVVASDFVYRTFIERGIPASRLSKIPYGVELRRFQRCGEPDPDEFVVLFVGARAGLRKGLPYLLEAFANFKHPRKRLVVIGNVLAEADSALRKFSTGGLEVHRHVPNEEMPGWFSRAHVLVLPSVEEGFGMVQAEAMACGCPVIATDHTGASELFEDAREGFIVPIRSAAAIRERLDWLAQDEHKRQQMGELAARRVRALGGWDRYGDAMEATLGDAMKLR